MPTCFIFRMFYIQKSYYYFFLTFFFLLVYNFTLWETWKVVTKRKQEPHTKGSQFLQSMKLHNQVIHSTEKLLAYLALHDQIQMLA